MEVPVERVVAAVVAVARGQGLPAERPRVVRDLTNVRGRLGERQEAPTAVRGLSRW
jgi:hypothetical protein